MHTRIATAVTLSILLTTTHLARAKTKPTLPDYVRNARTIAVLIDPDAGFSIDNPQANQIAQKDVESALQNWGRFQTLLSTQNADLIIVIRKGTGKLVDETIGDPRQNNRPGSITPSQDGIGMGGQRGQPPNMPGTSPMSPDGTSRPQTEIGNTEDSFTVYNASQSDPLSSPPVWRYLAKDGLRSHSVPAVDQFRKALDEADKAAAAAAAAKKPRP
jgi:hypothetical protein